jgi:flagellar basal-body rod protein FlgC
MVVFQSQPGARFHLLLANSLGQTGLPETGGVEVNQVVDDPTPPQLRYEPGHPDANAAGYVAYPAINAVQEMVDLMGAERAYELNASAVQAAKQMIQQSLQILK